MDVELGRGRPKHPNDLASRDSAPALALALLRARVRRGRGLRLLFVLRVVAVSLIGLFDRLTCPSAGRWRAIPAVTLEARGRPVAAQLRGRRPRLSLT